MAVEEIATTKLDKAMHGGMGLIEAMATLILECLPDRYVFHFLSFLPARVVLKWLGKHNHVYANFKQISGLSLVARS